MKYFLIFLLVIINIFFISVFFINQTEETTYSNKENFILACQKELISNNFFIQQNFSEARKVEISLIYCLCMSDELLNFRILQQRYLDNKYFYNNYQLIEFLDSKQGFETTFYCTEKSLQ